MYMHHIFEIYILPRITTIDTYLRSFQCKILPALTPQTTMLGLSQDDKNYGEPTINHVLLIFKLHVYNAREKHGLKTIDLLSNIKKTEYRISSNSVNERNAY